MKPGLMKPGLMKPDPMDPELVVEAVTVSYGGHRALQEVSLTLDRHEFLALVGPNGGGKSTLLKAILGVVPLDSGRIAVRGVAPRAGRTGLGYVPQASRIDLDFPLSVREVIATGALTGPGLWASRRVLRRSGPVVDDVLERLALGPLARRPIGALSGGQRQRVLIGRALAARPDILLLDEPTSNLDPEARVEIFELLRDLRSQASVLIASHDVDQVGRYADRTARLDRELTWQTPAAAPASQRTAEERTAVPSGRSPR